jgi:putative ABC transport system permease protein
MTGIGDIFGQVFSAIWANKLRSFLTMFGIAWGVGSLLLLVGLGEGFRSGQRKQMATLGNDVIFLSGGNIPAVPSQHIGMRPYHLTVRDADDLRTQAPEIRNASAVLEDDSVKQVSDYANTGGNVIGTDPNYKDIRSVPIDQGRFLNAQDLAEHRHVTVLGKKAAELLFPGHAALGAHILLNGSRFDVVGIFDRVGHGNNDTVNQQAYVPLTTMLELFPIKGENVPLDAISYIQYQPRTHNGNVEAVAAAHRIVARNHGFDSGNLDAFDEWDSIKSEQMVDTIFNVMDYFLGGVGIVTLGLGAVGIVNIMLVAVTERTREIGLRKALGATNFSIELQFLLEGLFLTGVSGLIGMGGAAALMSLLQSAFGGQMTGFDPPRLVPWSAALAIGSLTLSGVVAGLVPARQAARLEPVEALRKD